MVDDDGHTHDTRDPNYDSEDEEVSSKSNYHVLHVYLHVHVFVLCVHYVFTCTFLYVWV